MTEHQIIVEYEVLWTAGPGRRPYALAGGTPDQFLDKRNDLFTCWTCSCGESGATKDSLGEHTRSAIDAGQGYDLRVDRRGE